MIDNIFIYVSLSNFHSLPYREAWIRVMARYGYDFVSKMFFKSKPNPACDYECKAYECTL